VEFAGLALQALLALVLVSRRMWDRFPFFTAYALFGLLENAMAWAMFNNRSLYFYVYVFGEAISVVLGLGVLYEIYTHLFSGSAGLRKLAWLSFRVAVVLLMLLGAAVIYARSPIGKSEIGIALVVVEEAARILEVGLITFLFVFASVFGLHWRQSVFGITLGLGVFTVAKLAVLTMVPRVGHGAASVLNLTQVLSFDFSLLVWLGYMVFPERTVSAAMVPPRAQLEQWNQAIMELIHQ
jgi:hypothetical protein